MWYRGGNPQSWGFRHFLGLVFGIGFLTLAWRQITGFQFLYADGANDFFWVLAHRSFQVPLWTKSVADFWNQTPTLIAIEYLHITNVAHLALIQGSTLFLHPYVSLVVGWVIVRKKNPSLMVYPLLSFLLGNCSSSLFVISQAHLASSLFWPLFLYLLVNGDLKPRQVVLTAGYTIAAAFTYQSSFVFCFLIGTVLWARRKKLSRWEKGLSGTLFVMSAIILYGVINYPQAGNRAAFFWAAQLSWIKNSILAKLFFSSGSFLATAIFLDHLGQRKFLARSLSVLSLLLGAAYVIVIFSCPEKMSPFLHYLSRVFLLYVPMILGGMAFFSARLGRPIGLSRSSVIVVSLFSIFVCLAQWEINSEWREYYRSFRQELATHEGVIEFAESGFALSPPPAPAKFIWSWTNPVMSVLVSSIEWQMVHSIIGNPAGARYHPFDPNRLFQNADLSFYGVSYRPGIASFGGGRQSRWVVSKTH